ncbi:putative intracellular protein transport protein [Aureobasidium namibiae CBS 147.97]|uniref:Putative intracellular protein transport protein n=1 Tax=Aureobasidium namibiae CBS 147.97 TaxID=1043004 RepID=A0A074W904_9PEZI|nr:putative intracellular protein transport protein [Aureobasidium namibiae CBS 147.97]KEQ68064.1 putative intracellular protein transport protein [Aureobasidium namibiae CBS 147.97]
MLKAPIKQTAGDTIATLSSRLSSATLLEDRRAAILGLRSFAKKYPASVASGSLRDLIAVLRTDGLGLTKDGEGDVDTVRLVLETLLMLFEPDRESPEASEDIALWLADEFSQRQDNITILLDLLDQPDYYARIYSIQLLTAISTSRPERTQECILQAPLGTARLVGVLDDGRDAVRNAALLLLVDLTNVSQTELQKLIAFEDAFQRTFNLIQSEGGLSEGGIVAQDCLSLLANLIRHSHSNQALFRESGCIPRLIELVKQVSTPPEEENDFGRSDREKNAWGLLAVLRLFLERGELGTKQNQDVFWRSGVLHLVLTLAFDERAAPHIRMNALKTCADAIIFNAPLQEAFASFQVPVTSEAPAPVNGVATKPQAKIMYVIEALLNLVLSASPSRTLDLRSAGCSLIKAYFQGHDRIKLHFLQRAIAGYTEGEEEDINILSTLLNGPQLGPATPDPPRFAFASDITCQLLFNLQDAKSMLMGVSEGDADKGEDVITAIQTLSGHLLSSLRNDFDPQLSISYLNLLITFLFDEPAAVNDCLAEGSSLMGVLLDNALLTANSQVAADPIKSLLPGLSAILLGTIYEFSTKDSPIPRRTLYPLLISKLGRQKYFDALMQFRQNPIIRDSEFITSEIEGAAILFDDEFVDWFKDEYGRLKRVIDREPGIEVVRPSDVGVDRDVLDDLREKIKTRDEKLQQKEQDDLAAKQKSDQAEADYRHQLQSLQSSQRSMEAEVERIKRINEALQRDHDVEIQRVSGELRSQLAQFQLESRNNLQTLRDQHKQELERLKGQHGATVASERSLWEDKARKAAEQATRDQRAAVDKAAEEHRKATEQNAEEQRMRADQVASEHRKALDDLTVTVQQKDKTIKDHETTISDHARSEKILKQEHSATTATLEKLRAEFDSSKSDKAKLEKELETTKNLQKDLQQVNTKAMARVKTLEDEAKTRETKIQALTSEVSSLQAEIDNKQQKISELEQEVSGLKLELKGEREGYNDLETELNDLKTTHRKLETSNKELEAQISEHKSKPASPDNSDKLRALEKELADTKKKLETASSNPKNKKTSDDATKKEVEKEKAEASKARTELEDMLMGYREKLRKHGEEDDEEEEEE